MAITKVCDVCGKQEASTYSFGCREHGFWNVDLCDKHAALALEVVLRYNDTKLNVNTVPRIKAMFHV